MDKTPFFNQNSVKTEAELLKEKLEPWKTMLKEDLKSEKHELIDYALELFRQDPGFNLKKALYMVVDSIIEEYVSKLTKQIIRPLEKEVVNTSSPAYTIN